MFASRVSLLARVGAAATAAAIATGGGLALTGAASAAPARHIPKLETSLSIRKVAHPRHHFAVISGDLRSHRVPLRDKVVYLESRTKGTKFAVVAHKVTHPRGWVAFRVSPSAATRYVLVFKGSPNFRRCHSGVVTVRAGA